jgi:hypothetical protein
VFGLGDPGNLKAQKGSVVHKVLELLALQKKNPSVIEDDWLGRITPADCFHINDLIRKAFEWQRANSKHKFSEKDFYDCKDWTWQVLKYNNGMFDPRKRDIIACEPFFDLEIPYDWAKYSYTIRGQQLEGQLRIKGSIDLVTDIGNGIYEIIDYKTGQRKDWVTGKKKEYEHLLLDSQLILYYYAARKLYPKAKQFIVSIFFINDGGVYSLPFDDDAIDQAETMLKNRFNEIKNTTKPKLNISFVCRFCHFAKEIHKDSGKTICEHFNSEINEKGLKTVIDEKVDINTLTSYGSGGGRQNV